MRAVSFEMLWNTAITIKYPSIIFMMCCSCRPTYCLIHVSSVNLYTCYVFPIRSTHSANLYSFIHLSVYYTSLRLTKHFLFVNFQSCHAEWRVRAGIMFVNDILPIMNSTGKTDASKDYTRFVWIRGDGAVFIGEANSMRCQCRIECEPRDWNK